MNCRICRSVVGLFSLLAASMAVQAQIDLRFNAIDDVPLNILDMAHAGDGSGRLFLLQRVGRLVVMSAGETGTTPILDITDQVSTEGERGALSVTFPPGTGPKSHFYIYYTNLSGNSVLSRFFMSADGTRAMPDSEEILLEVVQPFANHNGGRIRFGPDGFLYVSLGDGGSANDPEGNGQNGATLLGSILRLDVESGEFPYAIPDDNPFIGDGAVRDEIWALGLRNPYRISFDRDTGDLYIADVGQSMREEINFQAAASNGGENYGWADAEGDICRIGNCSAFVDPVWVYNHENGNCSVTGGEVYRGSRYPALEGVYLYGDFCSGRVWGLQAASGSVSNELLSEGVLQGIFTFGQDEQGNVYVSASNGFFRLSNGPDDEAGFPLSGRISGQWVAPGMNRQGLNIVSGIRPDDSRYVFAVWYTYLDGQPFWIVGNANYEPPTDFIDLEIISFEGLDFLQDDDAEADGPFDVGDLSLRPLGCNELQVSWEFPALGSSGTTVMQRLANVEGAECG